MPKPERGGVWGILGGTFDPVHYGHIVLAEAICDKKALSGALFIPAYRHPFKDNDEHAPYSDRVIMLRMALEDNDMLLVNEIEAARELSGYTLDTIRTLKETYPDTEFRFIIGADNLDQINRWHEPKKLLDEVLILAGARPGWQLELEGNLPSDRIELVPAETPDISSTRLREMIRSGISDEQLRRYLPASVLDYIRKENLYV